MNIDTSSLRKLAALDDAEFSKVILSIATAFGFSADRAAKAAENTAFFRALLGNASDRDIGNIINRVGEDKIKEIYKKLPINTEAGGDGHE